MKTEIVNSPVPITLLGGGEVTPKLLAEALTKAPCLVAADGGASFALTQGYIPKAVIGDMDSLPQTDRDRLPVHRIFKIPEQDSTDFDKALRSITAPFVLGIGFLGGRIDHQLANFNGLVRRADPPCLLLGAQDVVFAAPAEHWLTLDLDPGSRLSLFPMKELTGRSEGLDWPIDDISFAPNGTIGTSNRTQAGAVRLWFDGPGMLVILPRRHLDQAIAARGVAPAI